MRRAWKDLLPRRFSQIGRAEPAQIVFELTLTMIVEQRAIIRAFCALDDQEREDRARRLTTVTTIRFWQELQHLNRLGLWSDPVTRFYVVPSFPRVIDLHPQPLEHLIRLGIVFQGIDGNLSGVNGN